MEEPNPCGFALIQSSYLPATSKPHPSDEKFTAKKIHLFYQFLPLHDADDHQEQQIITSRSDFVKIFNFCSTAQLSENTSISSGLGLGLVETKNMEDFAFYAKAHEEEEQHMGVSTKLKLYEDPWKIRKVLTKSDVNNLCRLMLSAEAIRTHVLGLMEDENMVAEIKFGEGARVNVWDYDHGCSYQLTLKRWPRNKCYVLNNNWSKNFVSRRGLSVGDEIGLFWDRKGSRFGFRVLATAPA